MYYSKHGKVTEYSMYLQAVDKVFIVIWRKGKIFKNKADEVHDFLHKRELNKTETTWRKKKRKQKTNMELLTHDVQEQSIKSSWRW